jgi:hypothetical protein
MPKAALRKAAVATIPSRGTPANRGPRTSTPAGVLIEDTELLLLTTGRGGRPYRLLREWRKGRYSAATTTAAARGAAQINCAALGEHKLEAGGHVG